MKQEKKNDVAVLLDYAGSRRGLTFLGLALSALSMLFSMAPYICIWLTARNLIAAAPEWTQAQNISKYGWIAFAFAVGGIILYFAGLMCTHLAAFHFQFHHVMNKVFIGGAFCAAKQQLYRFPVLADIFHHPMNVSS